MEDIRITRPYIQDDILAEYRKLDVATVHEALGKRGAMLRQIKPLAPDMRLCGRALTVKCHAGDNIMLIKAASMVKPGDVLVADMGNILENGPFGEVLAVECQARGCAGLVINCSVRDSDALVRMKFPVFSSGISVFGTAKASKGTINHPVVVGGILVNPGDLILGDRDGVVVVPIQETAQAYSNALTRMKKEEEVMKRLRAGESLFDIYGYQKVFDELGVSEERSES